MRKILFLSIPILLPGFVLVIWMLYDLHRPPDWQPEIEKYIAYQEHDLQARLTVQTVQRAQKPWDFTDEAGFTVFGDTVYYDTENRYEYKLDYNPGMPLPYPPKEVWCILLKVEPAASAGPAHLQWVLAALHQDIYNAGWVIHAAKGDDLTAEVLQRISRIGCDPGSLQNTDLKAGLPDF
jgi:hypothetical protein